MSFLKEIYNQNKMILSFAKNDFKNRYAGSYLGIAWAFIQPVMQILIFWFVFQVGFRTNPVEDVPFIVWFICGIIPWFYISEAIMGGTMSIVDYTYVVKKVVFNIRILPLVKVLVSTFVHLFFLILLVMVCALVNLPFSFHAIQVVYYSLCVFVLTLGISYITSAIVPFSKDVGQIIGIILNFGFWLTPIAWNQNILSSKLLMLFKLNPAYYIVQGYRDSLVYKVWFWERPLSTLYFWIVTFVVFYIGGFLFRKLKPHFADVL